MEAFTAVQERRVKSISLSGAAFPSDGTSQASACIIAKMYARYGWKGEKKARSYSIAQKLEVLSEASRMLKMPPEIKIDCIVVNKQNVQPHIRLDPNKFYNYMCKLVIEDHARHLPDFQFMPDKRSSKVESGNSLSDYLQTVLWFDLGLKTKLTNNPEESHRDYNLQFVDCMANAIRTHFEDGENIVYQEALRHIRIRRLFF